MIDPGSILVIVLWMGAAVLLGWSLSQPWRMPAVTLCGAGLLASFSLLSFAFLSVGTAVSIYIVRRNPTPGATAAFVAAVALVYGTILISAHWSSRWGLPVWVAPLGMAYYVLRLIHYVIEGERGRLRPHRALDAFYYQFFPPVLMVGPINRIEAFLRDLNRRRWDPQLFSHGLTRVLFGATKIVLIGNYLVAQKLAYSVQQIAGPAERAYAETVLFWINIYVQFSGYSDIAIGVAALLGFHIAENFNWPFIARNIGEFWRRWHITLSGWCRDYVYMPVLARWRRPGLAIAASMVVLGLWHEASLHYLIWGLYHATGLTVWRRFEAVARPTYERSAPLARGLWNMAAWLLTIHFVMFSYPFANAMESAMVLR